MKKTILITGCAGFIGSNLAHWIIDNTEDSVIGIDNFSSGDVFNTPRVSDRFVFFRENVLNSKAINNIFEITKPTHCFHLACYAAEGRSNYIRSFIHQNNTVGTANIINACINHNCKLIFTSSVAVYSGEPPFTEETTPNPIDEYGLSKWTSEKSIQIATEYGLDWCIIRPRNVYGKYQTLFDSARNVMGIWMYQIRNNLPMTIFGDGRNRRSFTYIEDILQPLYKSINVSHEIINLGSFRHYTILDANEILQEITGYNRVEFLEPRHEVQEAICGVKKSMELLGYSNQTSLGEGLARMWEWAQTVFMKERITPPPLEIKVKAHSSIK